MNDELRESGRPYIFRFRPNSNRTIQEIAQNYIFFADRNSLNDPFDSNPELVKLTENSQEIEKFYNLVANKIAEKSVRANFQENYDLKSFQKYSQEKVPDLILEFGIACFSMHIMNMPLWANYANNHSGVCLQFNIENDSEFFKVLNPIYYHENLNQLEFNPIIENNELLKIFFRKHQSWEYEKEIRVLKDLKGKYNYNKKALRNVILGYNAEPDYIKRVYYAVKDNYEDVGIYKLDKPTIVGKLSFREVRAATND
jgi:Protein of unknown function (DUF2971)